MTENMRYWDKLNEPPPSALKQITGGRLKGKSDINPQWRLEAMTRQFGPVGEGWKYTIDKLWTEPAGDEICAFALVSIYVKSGDKWGEAIPGIGGNKLIEKERSGPYVNDEAFKMATTDALSVSMKSLGMASKIYEGLWDGSKYARRPEYAVSDDMLNALKKKYSEGHAFELEGMDRPAKQQAFSAWCLGLIGEMVDYREAKSWTREWYDRCITALNVPFSVPFEE